MDHEKTAIEHLAYAREAAATASGVTYVLIGIGHALLALNGTARQLIPEDEAVPGAFGDVVSLADCLGVIGDPLGKIAAELARAREDVADIRSVITKR